MALSGLRACTDPGTIHAHCKHGEVHLSTSPSICKMDDSLVTPKGRTSKVWQHFGFRKDNKEGKKAVCKICKAGVVHAGGTTNLKTHLYTVTR